MTTDSSNGQLSKKDEQARAIIDECLSHASLYQEDRRRNWDLYEGIRKNKEEKQTKFNRVYRSHTGAKAVEQLATFSTQALTNEGGQIFRVAPYNNVEVARQAAAATVLLNYYVSNLNIVEDLYKTLFEAECFGTGIMEVEYKTLYIKVPDEGDGVIQLKLGEDGKFGAIRASKYKDEPYIQQPFVRQVRIMDFWADKQASCIDDLRYACIREVLTYNEIKNHKERYGFKNLEAAKNAGFPQRALLKETSRNKEGHRHRDTEYDVANILQYNDSMAGQKNPKVEVIRIFKPGTVQFVMNGIVISEELRIYPGVRFPFVMFRNDPKPGEFYGRSSIELLKNDIEFNEEMISLIHDKHLMNLKPVFLADANAFMASQLKEYKNAGPGDIVAINGLNIEAIREIKADAPDPSAVNFAQMFETNAKNTVSINAFMDGGTDISSGIRTDGGFELISRMGSTRLQNKIKIYAKAFEDVGRLILQVAKIFADKEEYISVTGALGDTFEQYIDPRSIDTRVKFKVQLGQIADPARQAKVQNQLNWLQMASQMDPLGIIRTYKGLVEAAATGDLFEDSVGMIETDPAVLEARAFLQTQIAGLQTPGPSALGSATEMQQLMQARNPQQAQPQQGQDPNTQPQQQQEQPQQAQQFA